MEKADINYLNKAFELAEKSRHRTSPNPFVGAVIVKDNKIIGRGWTQPPPGPHAEIQALSQAGSTAEGSTMYVTLEPCCHYGKTPPCTDAIIKSKIKKVVIAAKDPNPLVNGKGIAKLRAAGLEVETDIMPESFYEQNEVYVTYISQRRPFLLIKAAISLDGKMAREYNNNAKAQTIPDNLKWISSEKSREYVHHLRNEVDAILSTVRTVNADNPRFTVRYNIKNPQHPIRIILDTHLKVKPDSYVIRTAQDIRTILVTGKGVESANVDAIMDSGVERWEVDSKKNSIDLHQLMDICYKQGIAYIMVESGPTLISNLVYEKLVDKILLFVAPKLLGGSDKFLWFKSNKQVKLMQEIEVKKVKSKKLDKDIMIEGYFHYE
ncbi:MAG: bifunctional diaminohydroxyphosphoribosylaminopyrimidine deaminase/5-amino-6-(5-phosphoribosylamino)uracil reductase RibD [Candidatus Cloacimonadia bacterium]